MLRYIIWALAFYWLFRFIFNYVLPIFRTMRQVNEQVRDFQSRAEAQSNAHQHGAHNDTSSRQPRPEQKPKTGDYIDFEEIK